MLSGTFGIGELLLAAYTLTVMEKRMEPVSVKTHEGKIWIEQSELGDEISIILDPAQVPTLIQWLEEAAAELTRPKPEPPMPRKNVTGLQ
jgi:hypothetical protein